MAGGDWRVPGMFGDTAIWAGGCALLEALHDWAIPML